MKKCSNIIVERTQENLLPLSIIEKYDLDKSIFIDIECTGFNKEEDKIFSVSIGRFKEDFYEVKVYFNPYDEGQLLREIRQLLVCENLCTFNGIAFDEPFLNRRLQKHEIEIIKYKNHYDFYRILQPYAKGLGTNGCSLKNFEALVGIERIDEIDGKECRDKFLLYLEEKNELLVKEIIQHNLEDVLELPKLFLILNKIKEKNLLRDDAISIAEIKYITGLIQKRNVSIDKLSFKYLSQKESRKLIYQLKQKSINYNEINNILRTNYNQSKFYK